MKDLVIILNMLAGLLALISWESRRIRDRLRRAERGMKKFFSNYKAAFSTLMAILIVIDVISGFVGSVSLLKFLVYGSDKSWLNLSLGLTAIYFGLLISGVAIYILIATLEKAFSWVSTGNITRKWTTIIASLVVASSVIQLATN